MAQTAGYLGGFQSGGAADDAGISDWSIDYTADTHDTSVLGTQAKAFIVGQTSWTCSASGGRDSTALLVGTSYGSWKGYIDDTHFYTGTILCTGLHETIGVGDKAGISYDFQGTGALTVPAF